MGKNAKKKAIICVVLVLATIVAFESVRNNEFVNFDDNLYITENPHVNNGMTFESFVWSFRSVHYSMWHPLTSLSHIIDCELFGLNAKYHHMVSLLFHILNSVLLFFVLQRMTGALWCSGFVAAVFALHPLGVESVAWAAERKNLLSGLFFILTLFAYHYYVQRQSIWRYMLVVLVFCFGLMSKPTLVKLPFVLILLDYWPLKRFARRRRAAGGDLPQSEEVFKTAGKGSIWFLIIEKIPLVILSVILSVLTFVVQKSGGAIKQLPFQLRLSNAATSYVSYLLKIFYPRNFAMLYPHPVDILPIWFVIVSFLILVVITLLIIFVARGKRYLAVGWFWYLVSLIPVIGLVQAGRQAMADRYTYLAMIGVLIIVTWGAADLASRWNYLKIRFGILAIIMLVVLLVITRKQVGYWRNDFTLYKHTLLVTRNNYVIHNNYGVSLDKAGRFDEAGAHFRRAIKIFPGYFLARRNLGTLLYMRGRYVEAIQIYRTELSYNPDDYEIRKYLAASLVQCGSFGEAIEHFEQSLRINPSQPDVCLDLASLFYKEGNLKGTVVSLNKFLKLQSDSPVSLNELAWILATTKNNSIRDSLEAVRLAKRACELTQYSIAEFVDTLAVAYAAGGRFEEAIATTEKAMKIAQVSGNEKFLNEMQSRLELYKSGQIYQGK